MNRALADYWVSAKRKDVRSGAITHLRVGLKLFGKPVVSKAWTKQEVMDAILVSEKIFFTILEAPGYGWVDGTRIGVVRSRTGDYLRSDGNEFEKDNLEELPDF